MLAPRRLVTTITIALAVACGAAAPAPSASPAARDIDIGAAPQGIAFDFGSVWVGASDKGEVERLDPASGTIQTRIKVGDPAKQSSRARVYHGVPVAVASGFGSIWATGADETLTRVDPKTLRIDSFPIGITGSAIAVSEDAVWVASYDDGALLHFDPAADRVAAVVRDLGTLQEIVAAAGSVWATSRSGHEVVRFDAKTGGITARIPVERNVQSLAIGGGALWVTRESPRGLLRIDPATNAVTATYPAEDAWGVGADIVFADDGLWLGNVARVDPASGKVLARATAPLGDEQIAMTLGGGSLWIVEATKIRQVPLALVK
ncbi:MAG TPA: hypothetical protein VI814_11595 [Candidatus Limnocylindria bacterium]